MIHRRLPLINPNNSITWSEEYDDECDLYYNRHRYYDSQQGKYITQDPIGLMGMEFIQIPAEPGIWNRSTRSKWMEFIRGWWVRTVLSKH
ncbi:hypothetical protein WM46_18240 [Citrobacter freundii complex sp. CFNIH2]|nr:RHS repeat-associated core domain-containing protein [Citrobacter freundii complex sp. CFNIH2]AUO66526.1 hypothetical protein WM46_18240 [Citrobacter freundii complex sp. CFNIH2]